jgi:hypothetical protein
MMSVLREWGFPVGLLLVWTMAAAFTLRALGDMRSTQVPSQSTQVVRQPVPARALNAAPAS